MIRGRYQPQCAAGHRWKAWALAACLAAGAGAAAAQAAGEAAVMRRDAQLRASPADAAASLTALPAQAPVTRLGERQGAWIRVRTAEGTAGWVHLFDVGSPQAQAGSTAGGALRGLTSLFGRGDSPRMTTATSTIGIRGLGAEDLARAQPDLGAVDRMEALRQNEAQARSFGRDAALVPAQVDPLPAPPPPPAAAVPALSESAQ